MPHHLRSLQLILALLLAAVLASASAAPPPPPPVEAFFKPAAVRDYKLSPSGRRLAITTELKGRVGLVSIDLQRTPFEFGYAAHYSDMDVADFHWVDDERLVFTVVDRQVTAGEAYRLAPGLFSARFDGSDFRDLIARNWRPLLNEGGRNIVLTWNHELIHVPVPSGKAGGAEAAASAPGAVDGRPREHEVVVAEERFIAEELVDLHPFWLNTRTGRTRTMDLGENRPGKVRRWWFTPAGQPRLALSVDGDTETLHALRPAAQATGPARWIELGRSTKGLPFHPAWVGDNDTLYVYRNTGPAGEREISAYDYATRQPGPALIKAPGHDVDGVFVTSPDGARIQGLRVDTDAEQTYWFDPDLKALQQRADARWPGRVNRVSCRVCSGPEAAMVVRSWSDRDPGELLLWRQSARQGEGEWQIIATQQPDIVPQTMGRLRLERIRARDGRDLPVWLTRPAAVAAEAGANTPRPAVVLVHGGPWSRRQPWGWDGFTQFLASRGFVVIEPEFRGSTGFGMGHMNAGNGQWGQAMQDDVADALLWARAQGIASDKACIIGGSYGGYSTLMGLIRHPELYQCGSAWHAVADLMLLLEGSWFVDDDLTDRARGHWYPDRIGDPKRDRDRLLANSPIVQAARIRRPLQLIWGSDDRRTPVTHGERLRKAMQQAGQTPEWIVYQGEGHGLHKLDNRIDMARQLEAFLVRHLAP
ncbi:MAG: hypothetical protein RL722_836 [Pseudomonadota bacterium]|jgi:dipeptidyl aminopeptidase/acylaminoacyl peptidase